MSKKGAVVKMFLFVVVFVLLNLLSSKYFTRIDLTQDKTYTLGTATKQILKDLDKPVTIKAYFAKENMPISITSIRSSVKDIFDEYSARSGGKVVFDLIDPLKNEELEQEAQRNGVPMTFVTVKEKNEAAQKKAYLGAIVESGGQKETITFLPFLQKGSTDGLEYMLSSTIKKLSITNKPKVGLLQGHGEATLAQMRQVGTTMQELNDVEPYSIEDTIAIPFGKFKSLVIIDPKETFPPNHLQKLDEYLGNGGRLFVALNNVKGDFSTGRGSKIETGLDAWLTQKGISIEPSFLIDANCGQVQVQRQMGGFIMNQPIPFPYLPVIRSFAKHPVSNGITEIMMPFASPIVLSENNPNVESVVLATSSNQSGTEDAQTVFNVEKQWTRADYPMQNLPVAVALEGKIVGEAISKLVVIGDADFAINGEGKQAQQLGKDNVNFIVNAIDWLSDETALNNLRTKGAKSRPIKSLTSKKITTLKLINFGLPILLIILYGIVRAQWRRAKQRKIKNESYV